MLNKFLSYLVIIVCIQRCYRQTYSVSCNYSGFFNSNKTSCVESLNASPYLTTTDLELSSIQGYSHFERLYLKEYSQMIYYYRILGVNYIWGAQCRCTVSLTFIDTDRSSSTSSLSSTFEGQGRIQGGYLKSLYLRKEREQILLFNTRHRQIHVMNLNAPLDVILCDFERSNPLTFQPTYPTMESI